MLQQGGVLQDSQHSARILCHQILPPGLSGKDGVGLHMPVIGRDLENFAYPKWHLRKTALS